MLPPVQTHPWHQTAHHTASGFRNLYGERVDPSPLRSLWWLLTRPFARKRNVPAPSRPLRGDDLAADPERLRVTWLGHAAAYVQMGPLRLLLDPMSARRASPFSFAGPKRLVPFPLPLPELPGVDVVLLSHDHYDHLDPGSVRALTRAFDPLFLAPLGVGEILKEFGARRVVALDWGQYVEHGGARYTAVPAQHFSGRSLFNRDGTLWAGWYAEAGGLRLYWAGDTGYGSHFGLIREHLGAPDVAVMPVGAYRPRWFMREVHVTPEEALDAAHEVGARHVVPVHWGTFDLADEPVQEPVERFNGASNAASATRHPLDVGESWTLT